MQFKIPETLKNILKVMGLCNNIALENFKESQITEIENYIRSDFFNFVDKSEIQKYVGPIYKNHPDKFKFVIGHKNILLAIIKHVHERTLKPPLKPKPRLKQTYHQTSKRKSSLEKNILNEDSTTDRAIDLTEQNKTLCILINKYLKEIFEKETREEVKKQIFEFKNILQHYDYKSFLDGDSLACQIECPMCKTKIKVIILSLVS